MNKQDKQILNGLKKIINSIDGKLNKSDVCLLKGLYKVINTEFRTGYDKEGNSYKYPIEEEKDIKKTLSDLLGEEFTGFKGQSAINKVYKERKGHVKNAFYKDPIGNITVCWGDDTCGLKHLEIERNNRKQDPKEIIKQLGKVIENGHIFKEESDRWKIKYKDATVIISKELKNEKAITIITGYKKNKEVPKN